MVNQQTIGDNMTTVTRKTRGKYMTKARVEDKKQKEIKKNRLKSHKKAWDTRKALYPETNGYKPKMDLSESRRTGEERGQEHLSKTKEEVTVDVPEEKKVGRVTDELAERIDNLDNFLNSIPGVKFNRDEFIHETLTIAVNTILSRVAVVCHGEEELMKQLKGMMEFVEEA